MERITLDDARAHLNEIIDRVEAGETVEITREGKLAARLVPATSTPKRKVDIEALQSLDKIIPYQQESSADLVRRMRDSGY